MADERTLLAIIGATASGKSALAMEVARKTGAEILSVDSMQVYRGMDVGTAKPTIEERREVSHYLIDVVEPNEPFSAARFVEMAEAALESRGLKVESRGPLIATGGTPMYFKALFEGLFEGPGADEAVRARLREMPGVELHEKLKRLDPAAAERIHVADQKRLVRALEVYELTGKPISQLQQQWEKNQPARHPAVWVGLAWERDELNRRINARVKEMISRGWAEEVRELVRKFGVLSKTAAEATGYAELIEYGSGKIPLEEAVERIKIGTRQLARRQMKSFRRFADVKWLDGRQPLQTNVEAVLQLWDQRK
jgi:tRNA dimethylallyltransferase